MIPSTGFPQLLMDVPPPGCSGRADVLRVVKNAVVAFLDAYAPRVNRQSLWMVLGEVVKNTVDHGSQQASLSLWTDGTRLLIRYEEPLLPWADGEAILDRLQQPDLGSALEGNGINLGLGLSMMRTAAQGLGGLLLVYCGTRRLALAEPAGLDAGKLLDQALPGRSLVYLAVIPGVSE